MVKIAVIGCGYWGPNLIRNFSQLEEADLVYACDLDEIKLQRVKKTYPNIKTTQNYLEILQDPQVNGVCIATPLETHYKIAKDALLADKNVLIEKPMTATVQEAQELVRIAKDRGLILAVDHIFIYTGAVQKIKELIALDALGKIRYFDSERINLGLLRSDTNVVGDLAVHDISIINYLFDQKPISVSAAGASPVLNGKEEMVHINLRHEGGMMSHIYASWLSPVKLRRILVGGDKKMVLYDDVDPTEKVKIYDKGIDVDPKAVTAFNPFYRGGDIVIPKLDQTEALKKLSEHFLDCIQRRKAPLTDGQQGVEVLKILEAVQKSLSSDGQFIDITR